MPTFRVDYIPPLAAGGTAAEVLEHRGEHKLVCVEGGQQLLGWVSRIPQEAAGGGEVGVAPEVVAQLVGDVVVLGRGAFEQQRVAEDKITAAAWNRWLQTAQELAPVGSEPVALPVVKEAMEKAYKKATPAQQAALTLNAEDLEPAAGYDAIPPEPAPPADGAEAAAVQVYKDALAAREAAIRKQPLDCIWLRELRWVDLTDDKRGLGAWRRLLRALPNYYSKAARADVAFGRGLVLLREQAMARHVRAGGALRMHVAGWRWVVHC